MRQSVDIAIPTTDGRFVGLRCPKHGLKASLPGGKVELGESLEDGAIRECLEETGLRIIGLKAYYSAPIGWDDFQCTSFKGETLCHDPEWLLENMKSSEEGEVVLVTRDELMDGVYRDYYVEMFKWYDALNWGTM